MHVRRGFFDALVAALAKVLAGWHLMREVPGPQEVWVASAVGVLALAVGLLIASRLLAPAGTFAVVFVALTWVGIAVGAGAVAFQLAPLPQAGVTLLALAALAAMGWIARVALETSGIRALGTMVVTGIFGGLIAVLLAEAVRLSNAI